MIPDGTSLPASIPDACGKDHITVLLHLKQVMSNALQQMEDAYTLHEWISGSPRTAMAGIALPHISPCYLRPTLAQNKRERRAESSHGSPTQRSSFHFRIGD